MKKIKFVIIIHLILLKFSNVYANDSFEEWKINFSNYAISQGISKKTLSLVINDLNFLPKVIEYDNISQNFMKIHLHILIKELQNLIYN